MNHRGLIVWVSLLESEACKTTVCLVLSTVTYDKWMQGFKTGGFLVFLVFFNTKRSRGSCSPTELDHQLLTM